VIGNPEGWSYGNRFGYAWDRMRVAVLTGAACDQRAAEPAPARMREVCDALDTAVGC
jgi:hypothetical protein